MVDWIRFHVIMSIGEAGLRRETTAAKNLKEKKERRKNEVYRYCA